MHSPRIGLFDRSGDFVNWEVDMACNIPLMSSVWPDAELDTPITPRENLMRAFNHEKPVWMPDLYKDTQIVMSHMSRDMAPSKLAAGVDWFGTEYIFSESAGINMPHGGVFDEVTEWRDKVHWPDMSTVDWARDADGFVRDETKALGMRMSNGIFERLHAFEGFEQALIDIYEEPEECRDFFEHIADYRIELFNHHRDVFPLDYIIAADDYGTALAPFFSPEWYEKTLLEPTKRFVDAVHARGTKFLAHCCGKVEVFVPYFADVLKVDGIEIQMINNMPEITKKYSDRLLVEIHCDPEIIYDDEVNDDQIISHAHGIVDTYGAHVCPGSGATVNIQSSYEHTYRLLKNEIYHYSLEKYRG